VQGKSSDSEYVQKFPHRSGTWSRRAALGSGTYAECGEVPNTTRRNAKVNHFRREGQDENTTGLYEKESIEVVPLRTQ
jgi:hypothetical protein